MGSYLTTFLLLSHLLASINCDIRKKFGPGPTGPWKRDRSSYLLTVPETSGITLSLQLLLLLPLANTLGYLVTENIRNYISDGVMPFLLLLLKGFLGWHGSCQRKFTGVLLGTMTLCSRMAFGTMQACFGLCPQGLVTAHSRRSSLQFLVATGTDGMTLYSVALS